MIVGRDRCYITSLEDPNTTAFVEELQRRLSHPAGSHAAMGISPSVPALPQMSAAAGADNKAPFLGQHHSMPDTAASMGQVAPHMELPFELRVLECALDLVCRHLEQQVVDLEAAAHPALDGLTQKINTPNLERVRRIKNRMVRLTTRVETVRPASGRQGCLEGRGVHRPTLCCGKKKGMSA